MTEPWRSLKRVSRQPHAGVRADLERLKRDSDSGRATADARISASTPSLQTAGAGQAADRSSGLRATLYIGAILAVVLGSVLLYRFYSGGRAHTPFEKMKVRQMAEIRDSAGKSFRAYGPWMPDPFSGNPTRCRRPRNRGSVRMESQEGLTAKSVRSSRSVQALSSASSAKSLFPSCV